MIFAVVVFCLNLQRKAAVPILLLSDGAPSAHRQRPACESVRSLLCFCKSASCDCSVLDDFAASFLLFLFLELVFELNLILLKMIHGHHFLFRSPSLCLLQLLVLFPCNDILNDSLFIHSLAHVHYCEFFKH